MIESPPSSKYIQFKKSIVKYILKSQNFFFKFFSSKHEGNSKLYQFLNIFLRTVLFGIQYAESATTALLYQCCEGVQVLVSRFLFMVTKTMITWKQSQPVNTASYILCHWSGLSLSTSTYVIIVINNYLLIQI